MLVYTWSRRVIGYALAPLLDASLPLAALEGVLKSGHPDACFTPTAARHTPLGSTASDWYRPAGLVGSMARASKPYENAHIEGLMTTPKHEEIYLKGYRTMADPSAVIPG